MTDNMKSKYKERLKYIEDRKIQILLEIASINNNYNENVSRLNSEYEQLHEEYFQLKSEFIKKRKVCKVLNNGVI